MGRAERRRQEKEQARRPVTYHLTDRQIAEMKQAATQEASEQAFLMMIGIPILVMKDHFGQLIRKEYAGKTREQRFYEYCEEMYKSFQEGYFGVEDIIVTLKEECGIQAVEIR